MLLFKVALKNLVGAGIRTYLNVIVLAIVIFMVILTQGIYQGMSEDMTRARKQDEIAGGQYWHKSYDPFDPLTFDESHSLLNQSQQEGVAKGEIAPILIRRANIYPNGRFQQIQLKGIDPNQKVLQFPTEKLLQKSDPGNIPAIIGKRMARQIEIKKGDLITVRWRTSGGAFDAADLQVMDLFDTKVPVMDAGQIWIPLTTLQSISDLKNHASMMVVKEGYDKGKSIGDWVFHSTYDLLADTRKMVNSKRKGGGILFVVLLFLSMLAIFDTQMLSIFKRRREVGMLMAIGMDRKSIVWMFTIEGLMYGFMASMVALVIFAPLLWFIQSKGIPIPYDTNQFGIALSDRLYPAFTMGLVGTLMSIIFIVLGVVSYWPARKIVKLTPTDALRGKWI